MQVKDMFGRECDAEDFTTEVGIGWQPIVRQLFANMLAAGWDGVVCQVKEKFGGLRVYIGAEFAALSDLIKDAEDRSYETCENCGAAGKPREGSWIKTLCDKCDGAA